jgi:hypothetical protein
MNLISGNCSTVRFSREEWINHSPLENVVRFGLFFNGGDLVSGALNGLLAIVSLAIAAVCFWFYRQNANGLLIAAAIVFAVLMVVFGGMFLSGRVNKTDDIHITE